MKWILCFAIVAIGCAGCQSPAQPYNPFAGTTTVPPPGTAVPPPAQPPYYGAPPLTAPPATMPAAPTAPPPGAPIPRPAGLNNFTPAPAGNGGYSSTFQPNVSQPAAATAVPGTAPATGFGAPQLTPVSGRSAPTYAPPGGIAYPPQAFRTPTLAPANSQFAQGTPTLAPVNPAGAEAVAPNAVAAAGTVPWNNTTAGGAQPNYATTGGGVVPATMWQPADPARSASSSGMANNAGASRSATASSTPAFSNGGSAIRIVDPSMSNATGPGGSGNSISNALSTSGSPSQSSATTARVPEIGDLPPAKVTDIPSTAASAGLTPIAQRNVVLQPTPRSGLSQAASSTNMAAGNVQGTPTVAPPKATDSAANNPNGNLGPT